MFSIFQSHAASIEDVMFKIAFFKGNLEDLKKLIDSGVDVNIRFGDENKTPLIFAAGKAKKEVVEYLLSKGARTDPVAEHGTALHYAALFDQSDNLKILIESGADVEAKDNHGRTPLQVAQYPTAATPLILGGAIYPYAFSKINPSAYKVKELRSAIVAGKIVSDKLLTVAEKAFKDSNSYMPEYEGLYQETMNSIDQYKNPQLEITDVNSDGLLGSHTSQFYTGFYAGSFIFAPAANYLNDGVLGVNAEKPLFDYYTDKMNHNAIAKSVVFSFVFAALPNSLNGANKILAAKIVSDACVSGFDLSSEYASSLVFHLASSIASFSTIVLVQQTEFYNDNPLLTGALAGAASEVAILCYNTVNMVQNYMLGEDASLALAEE